MSLVVGFHTGSAAIIAADTRLTLIPRFGPEEYKDDTQKVFRTPTGLFAACGEYNLIDAVKHELESSPPKHSDEVDPMVRRVAQSMGRRADDPLIVNTSYLTSFHAADAGHIGMTFSHMSRPETWTLTQQGFRLMGPYGMPDEVESRINEILDKALKVMPDSFDQQLFFIRHLAHTVMDFASTHYSSVNRKVQLGAHTLEWVGIAESEVEPVGTLAFT